MTIKAKGRIFLGLLTIICIYLALVLYIARAALFPSWYHPATEPAPGSVVKQRLLAPCSSYQKSAYVYCKDPKSDFNLEYEEFATERVVAGRDKKVSAAGWWIKSSIASKGVVILVHGAGADRRAMLKHVPYLHEAGYDLAVIDCHNHGLAKNDKRGISFGFMESESVLAAIEWVRKRSAAPIVGLGTSQGAVSLLRAASMTNEIRAVVAENPFYSVVRALNDVPILTWVPQDTRNHALMAISVWHGFDFFELSAKDYGPKINVPVLVIHGAEDTFMPYVHSQDLLAEIKSKRDFWLAPYADHERVWNKYKEEYESRVTKFFAESAVHAAADAASKSTPFHGIVK